MVITKITTGIKSKNGTLTLDNLLGGGIPKGSCVLVTGNTGTNKSTFCAQILEHNANQGKKCLYVTFDQSKQDLIDQMQLFGFKFQKNKSLVVLYLDPSEADIIKELFKLIENSKFDMVVLDSIASLASNNLKADIPNMNMVQVAKSVIPQVQTETQLTRDKIRKIIKTFKKNNITSLLINEQPEESEGLSRDGVSDFLSDGIIVLYYVGVGGSAFRSLKIRKLRKADHEKDSHLFKLTKKGIILMDKEDAFKI